MCWCVYGGRTCVSVCMERGTRVGVCIEGGRVLGVCMEGGRVLVCVWREDVVCVLRGDVCWSAHV